MSRRRAIAARLGAIVAQDRVRLLVVLAVALSLRLDDVTQPLVDSFSWREASTAMMADNFRTQSWNILYPAVSWGGPGPAYQGREFQVVSYITAVFHQLFGWHDWLGRLVAICFSALTVCALYKLTQRVWGRAHAFCASLAYAITPGAAFIDRSFLPDPAMLALLTLGVWLFVRSLEDGRQVLLPVSLASVTLGVLAKLPGMGGAVPLVLLTVTETVRGRIREAALIVALSVLGVGAIFAYYSWALYLGRTYPPFHVAGHGYLWDDGLAGFVEQGFYLRRAWKIFESWYLGWPLILLSIVGLIHSPPRPEGARRPELRWLFHAWLVGAGVVYLVAAREITNNPWNLHVFSIPLAAFSGHGLARLAARAGERPLDPRALARAGTVGLFIAVFSSVPVLNAMKWPSAANGMSLGERLAELSAPGDLVIAVSPTVGDPIAIYYSRRRGWTFPPGESGTDWSRLLDDAAAIAKLEELRRSGARWFGVARNARDSAGRRFLDHHRALLRHLDETARRVSETDEYLIYRL